MLANGFNLFFVPGNALCHSTRPIGDFPHNSRSFMRALVVLHSDSPASWTIQRTSLHMTLPLGRCSQERWAVR